MKPKKLLQTGSLLLGLLGLLSFRQDKYVSFAPVRPVQRDIPLPHVFSEAYWLPAKNKNTDILFNNQKREAAYLLKTETTIGELFLTAYAIAF